jgi:hypothetical protein
MNNVRREKMNNNKKIDNMKWTRKDQTQGSVLG